MKRRGFLGMLGALAGAVAVGQSPIGGMAKAEPKTKRLPALAHDMRTRVDFTSSVAITSWTSHQYRIGPYFAENEEQRRALEASGVDVIPRIDP